MGLTKPTTSTVTHGMLTGRGDLDSHPQVAITGLGTSLAAKYQKPVDGIPKTDINSAFAADLTTGVNAMAAASIANGAASAAQTTANAAYVKPGLGIPSTDLAAAVVTSLGKADSSYQKPAPGIPESDFATVVSADAATANTIVKRKADGTIAGAITGDAATVAGKAPGTAAGNLAYYGGDGKIQAANLPPGIQVASGTYSGDNTNSRQINVGFTPKIIEVWQVGGNSTKVTLTASVNFVEIPNGGCLYVSTTTGLSAGLVPTGMAMNASGFVTCSTGGGSTSMNMSSYSYVWKAVG